MKRISSIEPTAKVLGIAYLLGFGVFILAFFLLFHLAAPVAAQPGDRNPVVIALLEEATIDDSIVYLDQIAKLSGGTLQARRQLARLDVGELRILAERTTIAKEQVKFRLLLAGFEPARFRLSGAQRVVVKESNEPITVRKIVASAETALRKKYPGDVSSVSVALGAEFVVQPFDLRANDKVRFDAKVHTPVPRAGKARVDVSLVVNGRIRETVPIQLELTAAESLGQRGSKKASSIRQAANFEREIDRDEIVVKTRDFVKMVADLGPARIEVTGEAMQDGRIGDVIRVRNIESNRVVPGRIEAAGIVTVEY